MRIVLEVKARLLVAWNLWFVDVIGEFSACLLPRLDYTDIFCVLKSITSAVLQLQLTAEYRL